MKAHITQLRDVAKDVRSFHIHIPDRPAYRPGQFLVLEIEAQGKVRKRAYSIASPPHWENVEILVKLKPDGKVTPALFELEEGSGLDIKLPYGMMYFHDPLPDKAVFLAGGVGLSAIISMLRHLAHIDYQGEVVLLYGNRTPSDIIYKDELDAMARDNGFKVVYTIDHPEGTGWDGETGFITADMILKHCDVEHSSFYICGPPQMAGHMVQNLDELGVPHDRVRKEQW